ncbi:hypothetical protein SNOG_11794 [Parastagonospora nodorum SN15]|uniref:Uncharacterized protein n=1 Tax=Phaeosphaeria nodorum (strain SN15 / ATCC MYA-4574 / FGSC 10173) TaxID=321614 RepID=Q0U8X0_PHANO|nr:hypothetical protein SNOG_11794 [Parastagonospora nodorum SN15]EAT80838.1 hypothetical protein SNOG_11794 [Parastagonospora nodorum SN15]
MYPTRPGFGTPKILGQKMLSSRLLRTRQGILNPEALS